MKSMKSISVAVEQPCTHRIIRFILPLYCFCIAPRRQIP